MMLLYVAWIAFSQAISDPCFWTEAASAPARGLPGYFRRMAAGRVRRSMCDVT
jgi:hypothetical protein